MAGTTSSISLASNGLLLLGHEPISNFEDGTSGATIAANLYETAYLSVLTNHRWRFATKQARLARLTEAPLRDWTYQFQLPADLLYLAKVDTERYEIYEDKLYANSSDIYIEYTYRVDEDKLPGYFAKMFEFFLAAQFAVSLTGDMDKAQLFGRFYEQELRRAKFADSTQRPNESFTDSPYTQVRY